MSSDRDRIGPEGPTHDARKADANVNDSSTREATAPSIRRVPDPILPGEDPTAYLARARSSDVRSSQIPSLEGRLTSYLQPHKEPMRFTREALHAIVDSVPDGTTAEEFHEQLNEVERCEREYAAIPKATESLDAVFARGRAAIEVAATKREENEKRNQ